MHIQRSHVDILKDKGDLVSYTDYRTCNDYRLKAHIQNY